ncbi:MAG TPA: type II toxin-antitoxin system VapC family toxin [Solirubrobacterales bacterium]|nr:type II toxin-antitoxin system VapC family toxin [Solirubrobacterales bacterium]
MKLPDVNLLLYAVDVEAPHHAKARAWLEDTLSGTEEVGFAWAVLLGFVRISTNPAVFEHPMDAAEAFGYVEEWLARPVASTVVPGSGHVSLMRQLLQPLGIAGNLSSDAHLAALAIEHGADLCSSDTDFGRFAGLRWIDPIS